jgi:hypothetical protein
MKCSYLKVFPTEAYFVSSLGSEALQTKINTKVTATIGDTNVELWCSYIKDGGEYINYIKMEARNKSNEEYLQIARFYLLESNRVLKLLTCNSNTRRTGIFRGAESISIIRYNAPIISIIHALNLIKC